MTQVPSIPMRLVAALERDHDEQVKVARSTLSELRPAMARATAAGLPLLAYMLDMAIREAEQIVGSGTPDA